jgi:hypothetical protein
MAWLKKRAAAVATAQQATIIILSLQKCKPQIGHEIVSSGSISEHFLVLFLMLDMSSLKRKVNIF